MGGWRVRRQPGLHGRARLKTNARHERKKGGRKVGKREKERRKERSWEKGKEVREEEKRRKP